MSYSRDFPVWIAALRVLYVLILATSCGKAPDTRNESPEASAGSGTSKEVESPSATQTKSLSSGQDLKPEKVREGQLPLFRSPKIRTATQSISFDDIAFKMEKDEPFEHSMLTEKITNYSGKLITIRGFILPSFKQNGLTEFVLVRDNMECCFGPGAALYDCVMVRMQPGKSTSFSVRPVAVQGKFMIKEWKDFDGVVRAIYHLSGESVK